MRLCKICSTSIDEIRLEILPNTDTCATCVNRKVYKAPEPTPYTAAPGTHFDELAVKNMEGSRSINQKSFYSRKSNIKKLGKKKKNKKKNKRAVQKRKNWDRRLKKIQRQIDKKRIVPVKQTTRRRIVEQ